MNGDAVFGRPTHSSAAPLVGQQNLERFVDAEDAGDALQGALRERRAAGPPPVAEGRPGRHPENRHLPVRGGPPEPGDAGEGRQRGAGRVPAAGRRRVSGSGHGCVWFCGLHAGQPGFPHPSRGAGPRNGEEPRPDIRNRGPGAACGVRTGCGDRCGRRTGPQRRSAETTARPIDFPVMGLHGIIRQSPDQHGGILPGVVAAQGDEMATKRTVSRRRPQPVFSKVPMAVKVRNFGPIASGEVELRPLTVFTGPSNTGKSWLATLIYIMGRMVSRDRRHDSQTFHLDHEDLIRKVFSALDRTSFPEDPGAWKRALQSGKKIRLTDKETNAVCRYTELTKGYLESELRRCYGLAETSDLVRQNSRGGASFSVRIGETERHMAISRKNQNISVNLDIYENPVLSTSRLQSRVMKDILENLSRRKEARDVYFYFFLKEISDLIFEKANIKNMYYFPADRGGLMDAHALVVSTLIDAASHAGLRPGPRTSMLSGVLADFLQHLLRITQYPHRQRFSITEGLEKDILYGTVNVTSSETGYPRITYHPKNWKTPMPLMSASSMVSELSPVVLFLQHLVTPEDIIILEEPEAHLHPAMQKRLTQEIATWVNNGIQVILTTHSECVLEELSNIVARGERTTSTSHKNDGPSLARSDVGVWLFDHRDAANPGNGSTIEEVPWNLHDGGFEAGFYDTMVDLNNEWAAAVGDYPDAGNAAQ